MTVRSASGQTMAVSSGALVTASPIPPATEVYGGHCETLLEARSAGAANHEAPARSAVRT